MNRREISFPMTREPEAGEGIYGTRDGDTVLTLNERQMRMMGSPERIMVTISAPEPPSRQ